PYYTRLMQQIPGNAVGYKISDPSQAIGFLLGIIKNPAFLMAISGKPGPGKEKETGNSLAEFFNNLQFQRLPAVEFIASFFGKAMSYVHFKGNRFISQGRFNYRHKQ
ncbi:MAG: hypothetical protein GY940_13790, partial [bacterium]|nr:hypothetical protein [bacterium]